MWSSAPRGCGAAHPNTDGTVLQIRWRFPPNPHFVCRDPIELQTPTVQSCCPLGSHRPEPFSVVALFLLSFSLHTWGRGSQCHHCILGLLAPSCSSMGWPWVSALLGGLWGTGTPSVGLSAELQHQLDGDGED